LSITELDIRISSVFLKGANKKARFECVPCKKILDTSYKVLGHLTREHSGEFSKAEYRLIRRLTRAIEYDQKEVRN